MNSSDRFLFAVALVGLLAIGTCLFGVFGPLLDQVNAAPPAPTPVVVECEPVHVEGWPHNFSICNLPDGARCVISPNGDMSCYVPESPMTEICHVCQKPLKLVGVQPFDRRGVEVDLMHCDAPGRSQYERTRSYHERPMSPAVIAARKEALPRLIAQPAK